MSDESIVEKLEDSAKAINVVVTDEKLIVDLEDGRTISVPLLYYPRLYYDSAVERSQRVIEGRGFIGQR